MVDTNCNPSGIDYVIAANDDAIKAIKLICGRIADAVLEGKMIRETGEIGMAISESAQMESDESPESHVFAPDEAE